MPKIIINEYDLTTAGAPNYQNFTVLVPGLVSDDAHDEVFDENGVYLCTSTKDFITNVGAVNPSATAKEAVPCEVESVAEGDAIQKDTIYVKKIGEGGVPGKLVDKDKVKYEVSFVGDGVGTFTKEEASIYFTLLEVGSDAITSVDSYGNQIAYELLSLGYPVLYKKMEDSTELAEDGFWTPMRDRSLYDFRYVLGGVPNANSAINAQLNTLAHRDNSKDPAETGRGDCIALLDIPEEAYDQTKAQTDNITTIQDTAVAMSPDSTWLAPYVIYQDGSLASVASGNYTNTHFPASFHYLACANRARLNNYAEWYAVAGYTRGQADYSIIDVGCRLGEAAIDALQPRKSDKSGQAAVNLIVKIKTAYYLWGNRTAKALGTADGDDLVACHFLNIRNLCVTLKKQVYVSCRKFTFDPNSDVLWVNFCNSIAPTLDKMKGDQGITNYKIVKVKTSQKAMLKAKIRIVPIEAVEDFEIGIYLEDAENGVLTVADID